MAKQACSAHALLDVPRAALLLERVPRVPLIIRGAAHPVAEAVLSHQHGGARLRIWVHSIDRQRIGGLVTKSDS